ncbi:polymeric immunoglobulin receptor-like [Amblyraja radiata]|uniref:polymeric immunoglobulin receptor-like n=1 Tax=Amblyraja radiata TaxID=386614 RepID=UPI001401BFCA|nr:polymeric immunoglobulin receptor-like [Amblyraja radiata]
MANVCISSSDVPCSFLVEINVTEPFTLQRVELLLARCGSGSDVLVPSCNCYLRVAVVSESSELSDRQASAGLVTVDKTMWIPILLISSLPVSGAVWAKWDDRGVVGRTITIDCHYAAEYRSHTKYWCRGRSRPCRVLVETNGQHGRSGRVSITDNPARGMFTVTVEDLHSGDTGWYSCGITTSADHPIFNVYLEVSDVSGAVWGDTYVRGVVGRAITIDCHYAAEYSSHTKYWCRVQSRQCTDLVETNGQHGRSGRVSITDNPARGIFTVTMEDLQFGDTGWYRCGITTSNGRPMFNVELHVSDEPVSAPVLRYLSPANASRLGGSVSVSCESVRGSLPIHYTWFEKNEHWVSTAVSGNQLDLSCEILGGQHRQYYCTASNNRGTKSSENLNVKVFKGAGTCSYVTEINNAVSGALWAESEVRGVVGRAITIDCHYAAVYRSHTKYWCNGTSHKCTHAVETNGEHGQSGRVSMSGNPARGIFTVTVEDLHSGDTGWYSCGITTPGEPTFKVRLQVSEEPVSVPVLGFLSPAYFSCLGGSVTGSCESVRGSLPINYSWYENTPSGDSKISDNNALDLHCQSFKHQHHQYYCTASNKRGSKSSEMVNVSISSSDVSCSFLVKINGTELEYSCETSKGSNDLSRFIYIVASGVTVLLLILIITFFWYRKRETKESKYNTSHGEDNNETQEMAALEGKHVDSNLENTRAGDHLDNNEGGITYAVVNCQRKSRSRQHAAENAVVYADVNFHRNCPKGIRKPHCTGTPENTESIYASVVS